MYCMRLIGCLTVLAFVQFSPPVRAATDLKAGGTTEATVPVATDSDAAAFDSPDWNIQGKMFSAYAPTDSEMGRLVGRTVTVSSLFAAGCLVLLWASQRIRARRRPKLGGPAGIAILETMVLAPKCALQLVRVNRQQFLIARDATGLRSVTPVGSFADTLGDVTDDLPGPSVKTERLGVASGAGISLESGAEPRWSDRHAGRRGINSWQRT